MREVLRDDFDVAITWMRCVEQVAGDKEYLCAPFESFANCAEKRYPKVGLARRRFTRRKVVEIIAEMEITTMGESKVHAGSRDQYNDDSAMCML